MPLYTDSSSIFGSIISSRHSSGERRNKSDSTMALTPTDLPDPVVPATSKCGMRARSATIGSPPIDLPSAIGSTGSLARNASDSRMSRR